VGLIDEVDGMDILRSALVRADRGRSPFSGRCRREWASKTAASRKDPSRKDPSRNRPLEITPLEMAPLGNGCSM
jgi:hypothetical protein